MSENYRIMDRNRLICRMCLQCNDLVDIYSVSIRNSGLWMRIKVHLGQEVSEDDGLPEYICLQCIKIVCDFDLYCIRVTENQEFLRNNFNAIHSDENEVGKCTQIEADPAPVVEDIETQSEVDTSAKSIETIQTGDEDEAPQASVVCEEISDDSEQIVWYSVEEVETIVENVPCDVENDNEIIENNSSDECERKIPEHAKAAAQQYPKTLMKDGVFVVSRTKLLEMVQSFYPLKCQLCPGKASRVRHKIISGLFNHYRRWHKIPGYVTCCDRKFRKRTEIVYHMIWHLQPSAFQCSKCGKRVTDPTNLVTHMKTHEGKDGKEDHKIRCDQCGVKVQSEHFLQIHKNKVHNTAAIELEEADINEPHPDFEGFPRTIMKNGEVAIRGTRLTNLVNKFYRFSCDICPDLEPFSNFTILSEHYRNAHSTRGYVVCCGDKIFKRVPLIHHLAWHLHPEAFNCPVCGRRSSTPRKLKEHIMIHKAVEERWYFCSQCPKRYITQVGLAKHMISHQPEEERKKFPCGTCGKIFYHRTSLNSHVKSAHTDENLICHVCGKNLKRMWEYKTHMEKHELAQKNKSSTKATKRTKRRSKESRKLPEKEIRPTMEEWRSCPYCSQVFSTKRLLLEHTEVEHNFLHKCEHCNYSNKRFELYLRHLNERHVLERNYKCSVCGLTYEYYHKLKDHMNVHTREKKHTCKFCSKEYLSLSGLWRHLKEIHIEQYKKLKERKKEMRRVKKLLWQGIEVERTDGPYFCAVEEVI